MRLDKFLCYARFTRTRGPAAELIAGGRLRIDGQVCDRAHAAVRPGMVLSFMLRDRIRVVRILALPDRRGPPAEARACYEDLVPPAPAGTPAPPIG